MKTLSTNAVIAAWLNGNEATNKTGTVKSIRENDAVWLYIMGAGNVAQNWNGQYYLYPDQFQGVKIAAEKYFKLASIEASKRAGPQGVCINCETY